MNPSSTVDYAGSAPQREGEEARMRIEKIARDAIRALEPHDPELAKALRRELNSL